MCEAIMFDSAGNKFGQVFNEEIVEFSLVVRDHVHIDVMRFVYILRRIEREDIFNFKHEDIGAVRGVNFFWNFGTSVCLSGNGDRLYLLIEIFAIMIEPVLIFTNSMDLGQNGPEQAIIVVLVLDIDNALVV